jgi:benzoate-CoA ligase
MRIVDETGQDLADGEVGALWVRAASTALYYWNNREQTKRAFEGQWLRTGDRYLRDRQGFFWYQGRTDDVFKVSGQWVSPNEIESCLLSHPGVLECAVVGAADSDGLIKPKAFVVRKAAAGLKAEELQALVKERLQPYKYPRWVTFVDELPKTASGKIQRYLLRTD